MGGTVEIDGKAMTKRQGEVLDAALALLVSDDESLTMTAVARRASCSKETLYKWFGGRDGLLTATVQWQAAKVRAVPLDPQTLDRGRLEASLIGFATDWLTVLSGETSIALNRLAVGHAGSDRRDLGAIVLENGPAAMRQRLGSVLEAGRRAGLLSFSETGEAFSTFFGLTVRDTQIRLLLGERPTLDAAGIERAARTATQQFFVLFGTSEQVGPCARRTPPSGA
ncbi:transcriptional regulator, TetR family [Aureimonas phyllosphaerae]|nr:transcriptional regulator, TetR family [Aureimonas phyllosphaerae]